MSLAWMAIPLSQGLFALVNGEDYERLNQWKWCAVHLGKNNWYAIRNIGKVPNRKMVLMHREILNVSNNKETDHKNGCGLDNRKQNLRICIHAENLRNQKPNSNHTSRYKGVGWHRGKWRARIYFNCKCIYLGHFDNEVDAALAYNIAAKQYFGKFARLNII